LHRTIKKTVSAIALITLAFSGLYIALFRYDPISIPVHVLFISCFSLFFLNLGAILINLSKGHRAAMAIVILFYTACFIVISSSYLANFVSSYFWGQPMYDSLLINSYSLLYEYYNQLFLNLDKLPALFDNFALITYSLLAGLVIISILLCLFLYVSIKITYNLSKTNTPPEKSLYTPYITALVLSLLAQQSLIYLYAKNNWRGDLIIDTFFTKSNLIFTGLYREMKSEENRKSFNNTPATKGNGQNLILIVVDALRGDFLVDPKNPPPFISQQIENGNFQWIKNVYSTCSYSVCGIMSIQASKDVEVLHADNVKISEVLNKSGYHTYSIMSGHPNWYGFKEIYQNTYDTYVDSDISGHELLLDDIITDTLPTFDLQNTQPFFLYLRLMSTHEYARINREFLDISDMEYGNRVLQADQYLEEIFRILKDKNILSNTTVIITADHGQSVGEKGRWGHNISLYHSQLHVPFLIYDEKQKYPDVTMASTMDAAATLLDRADITVPPYWDGLSLLQNHDEDRILYHSKSGTRFQTDRMRAVTYIKGDKIYKYILRGTHGVGGSQRRTKEEIFDVTEDPGETTNLIDTIDKEILDFMTTKFEEHFRD